jgi:transposase
MESTGVYWKPVWQALEGNFELILANPYQIKTMPGRKTDARDSQWIAELLVHGLIRPSFIPPRQTRDLRERLCTIPGVDIITAWTLIAELGLDMSVFQSPKHAASGAGLCPGNHESGGKRLSNRTRKGNRWLRRALVQSAWGASRKKDCFRGSLLPSYRARRKRGRPCKCAERLIRCIHVT